MTNRIGGQNFRTTGRPPDRDWMDQGKELLRKFDGDIDPGGPCSGEGAGTVSNVQVSPTANRGIS